MNKDSSDAGLWRVLSLELPVGGRDSQSKEDDDNEADNVVSMMEQPDPTSVQQSNDGEIEAKSLDYRFTTSIEELDDNGADEEEVNEGPDVETPWCGSEVGQLLGSSRLPTGRNHVEILRQRVQATRQPRQRDIDAQREQSRGSC